MGGKGAHVLARVCGNEEDERWTYAADFMHVDDNRGARARHALLGGYQLLVLGRPELKYRARSP